MNINSKFTLILLLLVTTANAKTSTDKKIWDYWYTVKIGKSTPYGYYHELVEEKQGRYSFQNQYWKSEEGLINEEQSGVFCLNDDLLTPLFYNFRKTHKKTETIFDGNIVDGKSMSVRIKEGGKEFPLVQRSLQKGAIFSIDFPLYLKQKVKSLKLGQRVSYIAIVEDDIKGGFAPISGNILLKEADEFAKSSKTTLIHVMFYERTSSWYLDKDGIAVRIDFPSTTPSQKVTAERVSEKVAKAFLTPHK
jgi:hypothetical protein